MTTTVASDAHDDQCPRCRLRAQITDTLSRPSGEPRAELLDQLLDTVEAVRAVDAAGEDEDHLELAVDRAVFEALALIDLLMGQGSDHDD